MAIINPEQLYLNGQLGVSQLRRLRKLFGDYLKQTQRRRFYLEISRGYAVCQGALGRHHPGDPPVVHLSDGEKSRLLQAITAYVFNCSCQATGV
ncbi:hypothetical protein CEK28_07930 [Xenophilus sp. AP218F]|nr:hypothetical protein CEK28_07930 [Xenophilus sp. AP218F]